MTKCSVEERHLFFCRCGQEHHHFVVSDYEDEEMLYISVHDGDPRQTPDIIQRIISAVQYILRPDKKFYYTDVVLYAQDVKQLAEILNEKVRKYPVS
jgi:hypothetical protein